MHPHLLIFGFGCTAHFLAQKAREINISVTATTRDNTAVGYNPEFDCEIIHFSERSIVCALYDYNNYYKNYYNDIRIKKVRHETY